ncbi:MAG: hypothetical protein KGL39_34615 [Patescibacteria group bacterium]|nr:hypothetical protein [Patescibacteria group bacterium]
MTTTARERAIEILSLYLTTKESESAVGELIDAVADTIEMRQERRGDELAVNGITTLDYFAAWAMQGIAYNMPMTGPPFPVDEIAEESYRLARAMLQERQKGTT